MHLPKKSCRKPHNFRNRAAIEEIQMLLEYVNINVGHVLKLPVRNIQSWLISVLLRTVARNFAKIPSEAIEENRNFFIKHNWKIQVRNYIYDQPPQWNLIFETVVRRLLMQRYKNKRTNKSALEASAKANQSSRSWPKIPIHHRDLN